MSDLEYSVSNKEIIEAMTIVADTLIQSGPERTTMLESSLKELADILIERSKSVQYRKINPQYGIIHEHTYPGKIYYY